LIQSKKVQNIPRSVIKNLLEIVNKAVGTSFWKEISPIYQYFINLDVEKRKEIYNHETLPNTTFTPIKKAMSKAPSLLFSPGPKIGKNSKSNTTELFLRSAYSYAKNRIKTICTKLCVMDNYPITNTCSNHIDKVFLDILIQYPEVLKDRKIDQILICIIHAVCLIYDINVLFKHIIAKFKEFFSLSR